MELQRIGAATIAERLHRKRVALRQQLAAQRQVEPFPVPLIDLLRPRIADLASGLGRADRIITDLGMAIGMLEDPAAEMTCEHLGAEADAEERLSLPQRNSQPVDLPANEFVGVVGAHRAAEDDRRGMPGHGLRQRIAEARAAHVEWVTALAQSVADTPGTSRSPGASRSGPAAASARFTRNARSLTLSASSIAFARWLFAGPP